MKKIIACLCAALMLFSVACSSGSEPSPSVNTSPSTENTQNIENPSEEQPVVSDEPAPEVTKYKSGTYKVGSDMPAGEYVLICDSFAGYFAINKDSSGSFESIIANGNFDTNSIVTVTAGQYLELTGCYAVPIDECKALDYSGSGMFKVGYHIPAGEYKVEVDESSTLGMGYYEVNDNSEHDLMQIVANKNFEGSTYITVSNGQYLTLTACHIISRPLMVSDITADEQTIHVLLAMDDYNSYKAGYDNIGAQVGDMWGTLSNRYSSESEIRQAVEDDLDKYLSNGDAEFVAYWDYSTKLYNMMLSGDLETALGTADYQGYLQMIISLVEAN